MKIFFYKMNNLGNDFIIINLINNKFKFNFNINLIKYLSNRYKGIGFNQLIIIKMSNDNKSNFELNIYNSNGTEVNQCGNGIICVSYFLYKYKYIKSNKIIFKIKNLYIISFLINSKLIKINMGEPKFLNEEENNFIINNKYIKYLFKFNKNINLSNIINIGNNHCVLNIEKNIFNIKYIKKFIKKNNISLCNINMNFIKIINKKYIKILVHEKDVGLTKSCGSGACASVIYGIKNKLLDNIVKVKFEYGTLIVYWNKINNNVFLIGKSASIVFSGILYL